MTTEEDKPTGQLFTHVYLDRGKPLGDHELARRRIGAYCESELKGYHSDLATFLRQETGLGVTWQGVWRFENFFSSIDIRYVLNCITLIYRYLHKNARIQTRYGKYSYHVANNWREFVSRVFVEENLGYTLDSEAGVHYLVDEEFERNRHSVLRCLEISRYRAVRDAFERAHQYLENEHQDTKAAVRSMFESLEILARLMVETRNLNKWLVDNKLKPIALRLYADDPVASESITKMFDGFALWVDAIHLYRHGQGTTDPVSPPIEYAIYVVSSGASYLRWLIDIDEKSVSE